MAILSKVGSFTRPSSASSDTVVTGIGFEPSAVILLPTQVTSANNWKAGWSAGVGFIARNAGAATFGGKTLRWVGENADSSPEATMSAFTTLAVSLRDAAGTAGPVTDTLSLDADGFTLGWSASNYDSLQSHIAYLALGGDVQARVGSYTFAGSSIFTTPENPPLESAPAGTILRANHPLPFQPSGAIVLVGSPTSEPLPFTSSVGVIGSAMTQWAMTLTDDFGDDPTDNSRRMSTDRFVSLTNPNNGADAFALKIHRLSPEGLQAEVVINTLGATNSVTLQILYLGGDGCLFDAGTFAKSTGSAPDVQVVPTVGRPQAALFAGIQNTADNTTTAHIRGMLGVADGTNHRAIAFQYEDNAATANGDTYFANAKALVVANNATPAVEAAATVAFNATDMTLTWDPNDAASADTALRLFRAGATLSGPVDEPARQSLSTLRVVIAAHECGHATAALALGWSGNYLFLALNESSEGFHLATDEGRLLLTNLGQLIDPLARSLTGAPPRPEDPSERRTWARIGATVAWAGILAQNLLHKERGIPTLPETLTYSAGDSANFKRYLAESGESRQFFERACKAEARQILHAHQEQWRRLTSALLERGYLGVMDILALWHDLPGLEVSTGMTLYPLPLTPMEQAAVRDEADILRRFVPRSLWPDEYLSEKTQDAA